MGTHPGTPPNPKPPTSGKLIFSTCSSAYHCKVLKSESGRWNPAALSHSPAGSLSMDLACLSRESEAPVCTVSHLPKCLCKAHYVYHAYLALNNIYIYIIIVYTYIYIYISCMPLDMSTFWPAEIYAFPSSLFGAGPWRIRSRCWRPPCCWSGRSQARSSARGAKVAEPWGGEGRWLRQPNGF